MDCDITGSKEISLEHVSPNGYWKNSILRNAVMALHSGCIIALALFCQINMRNWSYHYSASVYEVWTSDAKTWRVVVVSFNC